MEKLKTLGYKIAEKARNAKFAVGALAASAAAPLAVVVASAEDTATTGLSNYSEQITAQFTSAASDITPIIIGVLGAGLGVFVIFVGIKLAKKMFTTVAK